MKKRFIALTSLCLTASALTAAASAAIEPDRLYIEAGDTIVAPEVSTINALLVVETDGTVPDASLFNELMAPVSMEQYFDSSWSFGMRPEDTEFLETCCYGFYPTENTYILDFGYTYTYDEQDAGRFALQALGRVLLLTHDWITQVYIGNFEGGSGFTDVQESIIVHTAEGINIDEIPELAGTVERSGVVYMDETEETVDYYYYSCRYERDENQTDYDFLMELDAFTDMLMEKYSDLGIDAYGYVAGLDQEVGRIACIAQPLWEDAGDPNADGEVNSADAAELLVQAAQNGSAVDSMKATASAETPDPAADVNADGVVDALDASYVLQYAAAQGSGAPVSWVELMR